MVKKKQYFVGLRPESLEGLPKMFWYREAFTVIMLIIWGLIRHPIKACKEWKETAVMLVALPFVIVFFPLSPSTLKLSYQEKLKRDESKPAVDIDGDKVNLPIIALHNEKNIQYMRVLAPLHGALVMDEDEVKEYVFENLFK